VRERRLRPACDFLSPLSFERVELSRVFMELEEARVRERREERAGRVLVAFISWRI
jgi:hypothetical protein